MQGCTFLVCLSGMCPSSLEKERKEHGRPDKNFWRQQRHLPDFRAYQNLHSPASRL